MGDLKKVQLDPVQLSIEPRTRLLCIKQGNNEIRVTRDQVNNMKKLREGGFESNAFTSTITPRNRFTVNETGTIIATCQNEGYGDDTVVIANHKKLDDLQRIQDFVDKNRTRIAWARELRGRW